MIKINHLTKKYGTFVAVNDISLNIKTNEIFGLLGLNGAGKSTIIKILCGLESKTSGNIIIDGLDIDQNISKIKEIINLSPQETAIANNLTVFENLKLIATLYNSKTPQQDAQSLLHDFLLEEKQNQKAKTLSGGQKRRLSIAMALITKPKILILDEPTLGLDIRSRKKLWEIIAKQKCKSTIILTTHYLEEAEFLADRIAIMSKGKLACVGTSKDIITQQNKCCLEDAFLSIVGGEDE